MKTSSIHPPDWLKQADGVTISGGEPFDQPDALHELLTRIRRSMEATFWSILDISLEQLDAKLKRFRRPDRRADRRPIRYRRSTNHSRCGAVITSGSLRAQHLEKSASGNSIVQSIRPIDILTLCLTMLQARSGSLAFRTAGISAGFATSVSRTGTTVTTTEDKR